MAGPPLVGALAELTSLSAALWLLVLLALAVAALAGATRVGAQRVPAAAPASVAA